MESQPLLGEHIRKLRIETGFSQEALAERADIHRNFLGEIERGKKGMTLDTLFRLSRALGVTPQSIIKAIYERRTGQKTTRKTFSSLRPQRR
ncbi:MAG: helix-turn-helix transcriptional regulator [Verrucomicrobia bacterium]|nr:helix-turn-helix transcriptional regulator [Verrucomicrobiota bacterium]